MDLELRLLEPEADIELYRTAYDWRKPKQHISGPQMSFEAFAETNPTHLAFGLFNGELQAVYFLREFAPKRYEAHFTSKKGTRVPSLLRGARAVLDFMLANGAEEVSALILPTNRPLRQFVTQLGMVKVSHVIFTCVAEIQESSIGPRNQRMFVKYAARVQSPSA